MPIPSDIPRGGNIPSPRPVTAEMTHDWRAKTDKPRRSVFPNYRSADAPARPNTAPPEPATTSNAGNGESLQQRIDSAVARCFVYRSMALAWQDPTEQSWADLCSDTHRTALTQVAASLGCSAAANSMTAQLELGDYDSFRSAYVAAFGHAARGRCPLNEIEYGDIKADPLFQPHRLADLAAFYRAFGVEVGEDACERHDHICLELEFMSLLAAKEAFALEHQHDAEDIALCRDAQKKFLREHLGRWTPAFTHRLVQIVDDPILASFAALLRQLIQAECARFGVTPGTDDLLLRPIDPGADSLCASCGVGKPVGHPSTECVSD